MLALRLCLLSCLTLVGGTEVRLCAQIASKSKLCPQIKQVAGSVCLVSELQPHCFTVMCCRPGAAAPSPESAAVAPAQTFPQRPSESALQCAVTHETKAGCTEHTTTQQRAGTWSNMHPVCDLCCTIVVLLLHAMSLLLLNLAAIQYIITAI